jgi:hypothetical protein
MVDGPPCPEKTLHLSLHKKQIENSPSLESHRAIPPVSRQYVMEYYRYYGWPPYWNSSGMKGIKEYPEDMPSSKGERAADLKSHRRDDQHLQSTRGVIGYHIQATDGTIGRVSGFLVDDRSWAICELVVETAHGHSGKEILIAPGKIERISFADSKVVVNLTQADIQRAAETALVAAAVEASERKD